MSEAFNDEMEELTGQTLEVVAGELEDEIVRSDSYREIAISLMDGFADREAEFSRKNRENKIRVAKAMTVGYSGATH